MNSVLQEVLKEINPPVEEIKNMKEKLNLFIEKLKEVLKQKNINAEIFVGGSFAKNTLVKKNKYDADVFLRFDKRYQNSEISNLTQQILEKFEKVKKIHGSRDYFQIKISDNFFIELIPVYKIRRVKEAQNITDLSYFHVRYIKKKVKSQKILNEIKLAKAFCYAHHVYGAESYIKGFSGYSLELIIFYYGSFIKFLKEILKIKDEKLIIDIEKYFKRKKDILLDLNASKLNSPIILIDPTYKYRNVLAALSKESLIKLQKAAKDFLKNPSIKKFKEEKTDLEKIKKQAEAKKQEFILIEAHTEKQEGDVAGSKLLKFYKHLGKEIKKYFKIKKRGFNYNKKHSARYYFVVKSRKEILIKGPLIKDKENVEKFEKKHKIYFTKKARIYSKKAVDFSIKEFVENWKTKNKNKIKQMYINDLKIVY